MHCGIFTETGSKNSNKEQRMTYGFSKKVNISYETALEKVTSELQKEGFGVLTEIDVRATLKKKLDVDTSPYAILGACNPPLAHKALTMEPEIGLLLPCNVIVYENSHGETTIAAIDAKAMMSVVGREDILPVAEQVNEKLKRVIENV
jgi:uncharacterized protein (DUF302 family)